MDMNIDMAELSVFAIMLLFFVAYLGLGKSDTVDRILCWLSLRFKI
jgi:hypothetical protein